MMILGFTNGFLLQILWFYSILITMDTKHTLPLKASKSKERAMLKTNEEKRRKQPDSKDILTWNTIITVCLLFLTMLSSLFWLFFDFSQSEIVTVILGGLTAFMSGLSFLNKRKKIILVFGALGLALFTAALLKVVSPQAQTPTENQVQRDDAGILNKKGEAAYAEGQYDQALNFYTQALVIYQTSGDSSAVGTTLKNIGEVHYVQRQYDLALDYYDKALAIFQKSGDTSGQGSVLNNIARIHDSRGEFDQALEYFNKALSIYKSTGDTFGEGSVLNNIAMIYDSQGQADQALDFYNDALLIFQYIGNAYGEGITLNNIGGILNAQGKYELALDSFNKALVIFKSLGNKIYEQTILDNIEAIKK